MAHARFALTTMYDWLEARVTASEPTPTDAEICERFGFESTESARTLLAELADAGRITIRGYGDARTITLGRHRSALAPVQRPTPTITKSDPEVERTAARLVEIINRGRKPAQAVVAENASALLASVKPPAAPAAAKPAKDPAMPAKTIQLPASSTTAITAVEVLAKKDGITIGQAAAELIGRGAQKPAPAAPAEVAAPTVTSIVRDVHAVFDNLIDQLTAAADRPDQSADLAAAIGRADAAEARATAAEGKLAKLKELFA